MTEDERNKLLIDFYKGNLSEDGINEIIRIAVGTRDVMKDNNGRIQFSLESAVELLWKTGRYLDGCDCKYRCGCF